MSDFVCHIREGLDGETRKTLREVCKGLDYYSEHEGKQYCVLHFPSEGKTESFGKAVKSKLVQKDYNFSAAVFPEGTSNFARFEFDADTSFIGAIFVGETDFGGAQFSGEMTDFSQAQFSGEAKFRETQFSAEVTGFSNARFSGEVTSFIRARFSSGKGTSFIDAQFGGEGTTFLGAQFSGEVTTFLEAQFGSKVTTFSEAQFGSKETDFEEAHFSGKLTDFSKAQFSGKLTDFSKAQFVGEWTSFSGTDFGSAETTFQEATLAKEADFTEATFRQKVAFRGNAANLVFDSQAWARFGGSRIEKPELLTFHTVLLHPGWFINADVRKVDFTDVKWYGMPGGPEGTLDEEIGALTKRNIESPYTLLSQACQRLTANAEENRDYRLANDFYYWSMDALRKAGWRRLGLIRTMYWALSGYGVRAARAFWVLLGIWAAFTILYILVPSSPFSGFSVSDFGEAIVYSLGAMARLNPEPRPDAPGLFQFLVTVEGLLGPLQIALLALAIRRKVMR